MKICISIKTLAIGGAEVLLKNITPHLIKLGYEIHFVYFKKSDINLIQDIEEFGANVYYIGELDGNPVNLIKTVYRYKEFLKKNNFDIIFDNSPIVSVLTRLFKPCKIVYLEHNTLDAYKTVTRMLNNLTYNKIDQIICCSKKVYSSNGMKGIIIDNCIDVKSLNKQSSKFNLKEKLNISKDSRLILNVANINHKKNQLLLVDAFEKIREPRAHLLIVGSEGNNFNNLKNRIEKSPKREKITLYGATKDVVTIYRQCEIFSLSSLQEGLPLTLLESMSFGIVPVCTNVGGINNVITGETGFVVESGDSEALANSMNELLSNSSMYEKMSQKCKERIIDNFSIDNYVSKLDSIFRNV